MASNLTLLAQFAQMQHNMSAANIMNISATVVESNDLVFKHNLKRYAYGYLMLIICAAGVFGNVLAFTVLSTKSMRSSITASYLRFLAVVDAFVLLLAIFRYRSYYILLSEMEVIHVIFNLDKYVQVYLVPFFWMSLGMSSYITLCLSLERYLVIRWPFTLKKTCWINIVRVCTVVAILTICLVTFPHFLCYKIHRTSFRSLEVVAVTVSDQYLDAKAYLHTYNHYLMPIGWYMGPWLIIAAVNTLLSLQVQKSSRIRVGVPNSLNPNRNLSLLIILIVGVYMVCHFPRCILALYCLVNHCVTNCDGEDVNTKAYYIVNAIADILNILNSCLNIVVYCFTGTKFRREVKRLLLCRFCRKNTVSPPTHPSVHVSLREVPATPLNTRKSFNVSFKELQLVNSNLPHSPNDSQGEFQPATLSSFCQQSSLSEGTPSPAGPVSSCTSKGFNLLQTDSSKTNGQFATQQLTAPDSTTSAKLIPIFTTTAFSNSALTPGREVAGDQTEQSHSVKDDITCENCPNLSRK